MFYLSVLRSYPAVNVCLHTAVSACAISTHCQPCHRPVGSCESCPAVTTYFGRLWHLWMHPTGKLWQSFQAFTTGRLLDVERSNQQIPFLVAVEVLDFSRAMAFKSAGVWLIDSTGTVLVYITGYRIYLSTSLKEWGLKKKLKLGAQLRKYISVEVIWNFH